MNSAAALTENANHVTVAAAQNQRATLTVEDVAARLGVSVSWVRRHISELPVMRFGRLLRFDSNLLDAAIRANVRGGKSLEPERTIMVSRYQRGYVYTKGTKIKTWYGVFREDVRTPEGIERRQRKVRLGTMTELPTKNAARNKLAELLEPETGPTTTMVMDMTFKELTERWEKAEGPTMKASTLGVYVNTLRSGVLPTFGSRKISGITREDIQTFLSEQSSKYSRSSLRIMKTSLSITLGWALNCRWIPVNPCVRIKLPRQTGGRTVKRTVLTPKQTADIAATLDEPYATLVLFIAVTGLRIGEAIALKWSDFSGNIFHVTRRIYDRQEDEVKSKKGARRIPVDEKLIERMRALKHHGDVVFCSKAGTALDPHNALLRYVRPAVKELGLSIGGWHDFRHTLSTKLRRSGVHPKVVSDILGHAKVSLAMDVYDQTNVEDFVEPLSLVFNELLPDVTQTSGND